jgi:hypothetical protein
MYVYLVWKTTVINDKNIISPPAKTRWNTKNQCTNICLNNRTFFLVIYKLKLLFTTYSSFNTKSPISILRIYSRVL